MSDKLKIGDTVLLLWPYPEHGSSSKYKGQIGIITDIYNTTFTKNYEEYLFKIEDWSTTPGVYSKEIIKLSDATQLIKILYNIA